MIVPDKEPCRGINQVLKNNSNYTAQVAKNFMFLREELCVPL